MAGRVVDAASGDAVPFVDVIFRSGGFETTATSDDEGTYAIELPGGGYQVYAIGERVIGLPLPELRVDGGEEPTRFDVRVQQLSTLRGQVVDHRGAGVGGATVAVVMSSPAQKLYARSGVLATSVTAEADGRFELQVVGGGSVELEAAIAGLRARTSTEVAPGADRDGIVIALAQGGTVVGVVLAPDRRPVGGATVHLAVQAEGAEERQRVESGPDGRFEIGPIAPGATVVEARAEGYAQSAPVTLSLAPGARLETELVLQVALGLSGRVIDDEGRPMADVRLRAGRGGTKMKALETYTGRDGAFTFDEVDQGPYWVSAYKPDYATTTREGVRTPAELELVLRPHGGIRGQVADADRKPVRDYDVRIERFRPVGVSGWRPGPQGTRFSGAEGAFELGPLEPGHYDLVVTAEGHAPARLFDLEVEPGSWLEVPVTVGAGGAIQGRIVSAKDGQAVGMAKVALAFGGAERSVFSRRDGSFSLADVPAGRRSIVVSHPQFTPLTVGGIEVAVGGGRPLTLKLTPRGKQAHEAEVSGIGVVLDDKNDSLRIRDVVAGGPATRAGVRAKDVLIAVDGQSTRGLRAEEAVERLRGEAGTRVVITVDRAGKRLDFELVRARVAASSRQELLARARRAGPGGGRGG